MNLDEEMIDRAPIVHAMLNLKMTKHYLDIVSVSWQSDTYKIDNTSMHHILSKIFMDTDIYVYV